MEKWNSNNMLKIQNLKKYFGGVKAVEDCSFKIDEKMITALIGPNGAGKSTVFNLISGVIKTDSGKIKFLDKNITNKSPEEISNFGISRLFQQEHLFDNMTVEDNLFLAIDNQDTKFWKSFFNSNNINKDKEKIINDMLKIIDMKKFSNKLGRDLSYGQKRLIELVRTILNPHQFLILDEPVAGVNPKLRKLISDVLLDLKRKGETILLIEHDMNFTLSIADRIIVMDEGKVIAEGKPNQIKNNPKVLAAYLGE
jgi:branched-chain amino acid transport system ATP-binding protein